jgi:hypothetical protein
MSKHRASLSPSNKLRQYKGQHSGGIQKYRSIGRRHDGRDTGAILNNAECGKLTQSIDGSIVSTYVLSSNNLIMHTCSYTYSTLGKLNHCNSLGFLNNSKSNGSEYYQVTVLGNNDRSKQRDVMRKNFNAHFYDSQEGYTLGVNVREAQKHKSVDSRKSLSCSPKEERERTPQAHNVLGSL